MAPANDKPQQPKSSLTFAEIKAQQKLAANAARRAAYLKQAIATSSTEDINARFLRRGETLAFPNELEPYQIQAALMTVRNYRTGLPTLNASDVGLGKTREAICFARTVNFKRVLYLTFKSLVASTCSEISSLASDILAVPIEDQSQLWLSMPLHRPPNPATNSLGIATVVYVTNYEKLHIDPYLHSPKAEWGCVIVDECTKIKGGACYESQQTQIFKALRTLLHTSHPNAYRLFLSATPAENKPEELWAVLNLFQPEKFASFADFRKIFTLRSSSGNYIISYDKLMGMLGSMIIRHTVINLGLDLPSIDRPEWFTTRIHSLHIDPESHVGKAYLSMHASCMAELDASHSLTPSVIIEVMLRLRQLISAGPVFKYTKTHKTAHYSSALQETVVSKVKQEYTVNMEPPYTKHTAVESLIAELQADGEQVIVMSCFNQPLENLAQALRLSPTSALVYRVGTINGQTPQADRQSLVQRFQQGTLDVLLINKRAAAHGLNLQKCSKWVGGASHIIHLDRWFSPSIERQANGRIVRMNTLYPCIAHYFDVENSVDTVMRDMVQSKLDNIGELDSALLSQTLRNATLG